MSVAHHVAVWLGAIGLVTAQPIGPAAAQITDADLRLAQANVPVISRGPAFALRLSGVLRLDGHWVDQDIKGGRPGFELRERKRDVTLTGEAMTDRGLGYGFTYAIDDQRGRVYVETRLGRLTLGSLDAATESLDISGDWAMVGSGTWDRSGGNNVNLGFVSDRGVVSMRGSGGNIRYTSPAIAGVTVAVSFTPESDFETDGEETDGSGPGTAEDIVSVAARHVSSFGPTAVWLYAGYERGQDGGRDAARGVQQIYSAGVYVRRRGFAIAAGWGRLDDALGQGFAADHEIRQWIDFGLSYSGGPWAVSVGGVHWRDEDAFATSVVRASARAYSASFQFDLAPGLALMGGVSHYQITNGFYADLPDAVTATSGRTDNRATTATLSTQMTF